MPAIARRWTHEEDNLFRYLAELHLDACVIADVLGRSTPELRRRGYTIGLPRKWFRSGTTPLTWPTAMEPREGNAEKEI